MDRSPLPPGSHDDPERYVLAGAVDGDGCGVVLGAGLGGGRPPPALVQTQRETSRNARGGRAVRDPLSDPATNGSRPRRHELGRSVWRGWRSWVASVARELEALHAPDAASSLRACGSWVSVYRCAVHGDVTREVQASCGKRVCPWCSRVQAQRAGERVTSAAQRVSGYVAARAGGVYRVEASFAADEADKAARHYARGERAAQQGRHDVAARHRARGDAAAKRAARHRLSAHQARRCAGIALPSKPSKRTRRERIGSRRVVGGAWSWKLVTIAPPWRPDLASEYSPEGLGMRVEDVFARVGRAWDDVLSVGGLASLTTRCELSDGGHVHAHALYFGPHISREAMARAMGCHVWVSRVELGADGRPDLEGAVREAVKYALKSPSPLRAQWIAGGDARVAHPRLAAAWVVGTRDVHLLRHRGVIRDALAADTKTREARAEHKHQTDPATGERCCPVSLSRGGKVVVVCGRPLAPARMVRTTDLASQLGEGFYRALSFVQPRG